MQLEYIWTQFEKSYQLVQYDFKLCTRLNIFPYCTVKCIITNKYSRFLNIWMTLFQAAEEQQRFRVSKSSARDIAMKLAQV